MLIVTLLSLPQSTQGGWCLYFRMKMYLSFLWMTRQECLLVFQCRKNNKRLWCTSSIEWNLRIMTFQLSKSISWSHLFILLTVYWTRLQRTWWHQNHGSQSSNNTIWILLSSSHMHLVGIDIFLWKSDNLCPAFPNLFWIHETTKISRHGFEKIWKIVSE